MNRVFGNLLGSAQAEDDHVMLGKAFVETADYQTLLHTTDFSYVVGRRGTGKSAIFQRLKEIFSSNTRIILITEEPQDYEMLEMHSILSDISSDYRSLRAISRLLWTVSFILKASLAISRHYKFAKSPKATFITDYLETHSELLHRSGVSSCSIMLRDVLSVTKVAEQIPGVIASHFQIGPATEALRDSFDDAGLGVVVLYDRLDEAWIPTVAPIAILGGIAKMAADYREKRFPFYSLLFVRDNMFRTLAQFDDDFTRHIEGHSLRLQWNEDSLFHLVTARLRVALNLENVESEVKVWNRFAHRELQGREGFASCLRLTLYRPRDILVLLNEAYVNATREGRDTVIEKDIQTSATSISQHRLEDLCKEYDKVLPGLKLFISAFRGLPAEQSFQDVVERLQYVADNNDYSSAETREIVLFENGGDMFSALYSVGFIGVRDKVSGNYAFCHDGTMSALVTIEGTRETLVHPCYWKALDVLVTPESNELLIQVNDEYGGDLTDEPVALRLRRLGQLPEELSSIGLGHAGSHQFEKWVVRAVRLLFSGPLTNIELKPNPSVALNQRDVVATNSTTSEFWRRIYEDYRSRQIIFECKNYEELTPEDFRQVLDYATGEYGNFIIVVRRGKTDTLTENEKDRTRSLFYDHKCLVAIIPVSMLALCIRKLRTPKRYNYTEFVMSKHLDWIVRSVLSMAHAPRYKQKRKK